MLQIIPVSNRKPNQIDSDKIKYIENIENDSMAKKYNRAIEQFVLNSNEDVICFRHEDTEIRSDEQTCNYKIRKLTESKEIAVVGVIGTIALDKSCIWWSGVQAAGGRATYGSGYIIQGGIRQKVLNNQPLVDENNNPITEKYEYPMADHPGIHDYVATVDGCCMFFPKWFFEKGFRFDDKLQDFHFYDADICLQALAAGYKVSTVDIIVKHESQGPIPNNFNNLKQNFFNKWNSAVQGSWPISRLSHFDMSKIKFIEPPKEDPIKNQPNTPDSNSTSTKQPKKKK